MSKYKFKRKPRQHQAEALRKLIQNQGIVGLLMDPGCLAADTEIGINRGGKGWTTTIKDVFARFDGRYIEGRPWDTNVGTFVQRAEEDGTIRLAEIEHIWRSGVKTTYEVVTDTGRSIRATEEHPFLTTEGFKELSKLDIGDLVVVKGSQKNNRKKPKAQYKDKYTKYHPKQRKANRPGRFRRPEHHLVMEAHLNDMSFDEFMYILNNDKEKAKTLTYIKKGQVVHHKNHDHKDNRLENLELIDSNATHLRKKHNLVKNVLYTTTTEKIVSIELYGEEQTYDIEVSDSPHNFIANGFVVHNTGKTKPTIDYLAMLTLKYGWCDAMIAAPLTALDTWVTEIGKDLPDNVKHEIHVLGDGYSILEKAEYITELGEVDNDDQLRLVIINHDAFKYKHLVPGLKTVTVQDRIIKAVTHKWCPDVVVVDECHRLKTHTSNVSRAFKKIGKHVFRRIGLTGTVAPKNPLDVYGQWQFINPSRLPDRWNTFRYRVAIYGGWEGRQIIGYNGKELDRLKRLIRCDSYVAKKREVLDLHIPTDITIPVHLSDKERRFYLEMGREMLVSLPSGAESIAPNVLTKILRLREITSGFIGYRDEDEVTRREDLGDSKLRACMDKVNDLVDAGEKVVVFAHFRRDIARLAEASEKVKGATTYMVHGGTKQSARKRQREEFYALDGPAIFVAQMRTMSLAVNELVAANYAIFYSMSERRDDYIQARDRLDREGQTEPVVFYHLCVPNSIDEAMLEGHAEKGQLERILIGKARDILTLGEGA